MPFLTPLNSRRHQSSKMLRSLQKSSPRKLRLWQNLNQYPKNLPRVNQRHTLPRRSSVAEKV